MPCRQGLGNLSEEREREREQRQRHEGRGEGGLEADVDVASSICADRAITMKKKGLESRGRRKEEAEGEEGRAEECDE